MQTLFLSKYLHMSIKCSTFVAEKKNYQLLIIDFW